MLDIGQINFLIGEVESFNDTLKSTESNSQNLFSINVLVRQKNNKKTILDVLPANANIKQIPVIGENVLIFQGYNQKSSFLKREIRWYYLSVINIQSNINNNILSVNSSEFTPDPLFTDTPISPLQPFKGDVLIEGRWGNTIRLGSTQPNSSEYSIQPKWNGTTNNPIIILSNGQQTNAGKLFTIENIDIDASSLYLTSTQKLPELILNTDIKTGESVSAFNKSQFIGVADRIILKSKTDSIILDSLKSIEINTPLLSVGINSNKENGLHSTETKDILNTIIDIIKYGLIAGDTPVTINPALRSIFEQQLSDSFSTIDNKTIKQDKS
jgi:hypothetical protein